ncbi:lysin B [Mycobacterium phage Guanica15]|uniref:Lysin B n=1 Tax=Mycobacterium phage Yunkel11 TaxID=2599886 RepID=A0A5J6TFA2_9CAUD|nr:lysin B [Mycobacterium phage Yunkel11]QFG08419.1 lysin B [Mycobacterium phage Yunkel11]QFG09223.1 lysin B [Mycobacterium phage Efra2]QFG11642.1 lysin B [Mycobacterium phage Guanica15]
MSKPMLLTAQGTGVDMYTGYPHDLGVILRDEGLVELQPIGKYPAKTWPMGPSVKIGVDEGVNLVLLAEARPAALVPDGYLVAGYSQGAWLVSDLLDEFRTGRLKHLRHKLIGGVTFGNPRRALDDRGGRGIADKLIVDTPEFWVDEFDPGDIYANVPNNDVGEDMTAIFKLVRLNGISDVIDLGSVIDLGGIVGGVALGGNPLGGVLGGLGGLLGGSDQEQNNITEQIVEMLRSPLREFPAAVGAIVKAFTFFGRKPITAPHVEYHLREVTPGVTYFEHAVAHMRAMAA